MLLLLDSRHPQLRELQISEVPAARTSEKAAARQPAISPCAPVESKRDSRHPASWASDRANYSAVASRVLSEARPPGEY
ncbi:hypothetical protein TgHK011_006087 [Trichoderma gracile]|nr:hypothetical protein TgHK011_006087 [Trichoderma gracile]